MKKTLLIFILFVTAFATKGAAQASPSMTIYNNSACAVGIVIGAIDGCTSFVSCSQSTFISYAITIPAGHSVYYSDITAVNTGSGGPGWHTLSVGSVTACSSAGGAWYGVRFGTGFSCWSDVGTNACVSTASSNSTGACGCGVSGWNATYNVDPLTGNVTVVIN